MGFEEYKPVIVMVFLEFGFAGLNLIGKTALLHDMSSRVFVVYKQILSFLFFAPIAYSKRRQGGSICNLGWRSFCLIFLATFLGVTANQNFYFEGMNLASASVTTAFSNLSPAITFLMSYVVGLEKVNFSSWRSWTQIIGTVISVTGAMAIALLKGPKLLKQHFLEATKSSFHQAHDNWLLGCLLSFVSACTWSSWLMLQVPLTASCPDLVSLAAWISLIGALQSAVITLILEPGTKVWRINSYIELFCCLYAGSESAISFFGHAWCISRRGPLFSAMFSPLPTVIVTIFACIFLGEDLYIGSLAGGVFVTLGLYLVLWGKAKDVEDVKSEAYQTRGQNHQTVFVDGYPGNASGRIDVEQPLLPDRSTNCPCNMVE